VILTLLSKRRAARFRLGEQKRKHA